MMVAQLSLMPSGGQAARDPGGVGVGQLAHQQLGADANDLGVQLNLRRNPRITNVEFGIANVTGIRNPAPVILRGPAAGRRPVRLPPRFS